jgi:cation diffusion facilitator CzcD-associated flavoprotein CzcO
MTAKNLPYVVIGAGPCGLAMARNFQKLGISFVGLDKHFDVGGLWDIKNPHSTMYESAHLISSKKMTEFTEFPMAEDVPDYPAHGHLQKYFKDYSDHFKLGEQYRFGATVTKVSQNPDQTWKVEYTQGSKNETIDAKGVVLATGTLHYPNMPKLKGNFSGEIIHSAQYKTAEIFKGKRVLIVGAGNSGCDIAVDAVHQAKSVDMSLRRGYHFVPKYVFGRPADTMRPSELIPEFIRKAFQKIILKLVVGNPTRFGFPAPDHKMFESHPIVNSLVLYHAGHGDIKVQKDIDHVEGKKVYFVDGTTAEYDLILMATGYKLQYPFIESHLLNWQGAAPQLYLNIFHPKLNNLFVMGMVEALGIGWQGRFEQAELIARYVSSMERNTSQAAKFNELKQLNQVDLSGGMNYIKLDRMAYYVHKETYLDEIRKAATALL